MINYNDLKKHEPLFGAWKIDKIIGEGAFGDVYLIIDNSKTELKKAALKIISLPPSDTEVVRLITSGMTEEEVIAYYEAIVEDVCKEVDVVESLSYSNYIVKYDQHKIIRCEDKIGWHIFVKMELVTPLSDIMKKKVLPEDEIIKMGINICKALELCKQYNIIHKDIKPGNIFYSEEGYYKLGDFGIAENSKAVTSKRLGTYEYMAPEVFGNKEYNYYSDLYSLGIVMYELLNDNNLPFISSNTEIASFAEHEESIYKRLKNKESMAEPKRGCDALKRIVMKACAYEIVDRFFEPEDIRRELEKIL